MGNCQAIDNASLVIQQPNGRVDKQVYYSRVSAGEIMKLNPGHYVALLLTTTASYTSTSSNTTGERNVPIVRVTRIKLLRPSDTLVLGHVYRLVTSQDVMKGLKAKNKQRQQEKGHAAAKNVSDSEKTSKQSGKAKARQRSRSNTKANSSTASKGFRTWQPSLNSISETAAGTYYILLLFPLYFLFFFFIMY